MNNRLQFKAFQELYNNEYVLIAKPIDQPQKGVCFVTATLQQNTTEENCFADPFLRLNPAEARSIMDALWEAGLRPSNLIETNKEVEAIKNHLSSESKTKQQLLDYILK
jgi:hypothetical protein